MKIQIRKGVFETNSSSVHSLVVSKTEDYEGFQKGTMWARDEEDLMPMDEAIEYNIKVLKDRDYTNEEFFKLYREKKNFWDAFSAMYDENDESKYADWEEFKDEYEVDSCYSYYLPWDEYWDSDYMQYYESYSRDIVTEHGDKITVWGYYGHD